MSPLFTLPDCQYLYPTTICSASWTSQQDISRRRWGSSTNISKQTHLLLQTASRSGITPNLCSRSCTSYIWSIILFLQHQQALKEHSVQLVWLTQTDVPDWETVSLRTYLLPNATMTCFESETMLWLIVTILFSALLQKYSELYYCLCFFSSTKMLSW